MLSSLQNADIVPGRPERWRSGAGPRPRRSSRRWRPSSRCTRRRRASGTCLPISGPEMARPVRRLAVVVLHFARCAVAEQILAQPHAADAQRSENGLSHELMVRPSRDGLDHPAQHAVAEVGIGVGRAGREIQRLAHRVADDLPGMDRQRNFQRLGDVFGGLGAHRVERFVAVPTAGVLQAVPHGNLVPARVHAGAAFQSAARASESETRGRRA